MTSTTMATATSHDPGSDIHRNNDSHKYKYDPGSDGFNNSIKVDSACNNDGDHPNGSSLV
jgi:hypothetical protein